MTTTEERSAYGERLYIVDYIEYRANRTQSHDAKVALLVLASYLRAEFHLPGGTTDEGKDK
jgi:hypothetical protein